MSETSDFIRKTFKEGDDIRDAGLTIPEDVTRFIDLPYGSDEKWQKLDVYRPKDIAGKLPVIISVHGGGWVYGDKELYKFYCMSLAQRGFAVVNFTYRLAPEYKYPASIEDTNLVAAWVMEHSREYELDTDHIFAVGDSAGAHNLGLYAGFLTNEEYQKTYPFQPPKGFLLKAIALNCGAYKISINQPEDAETKKLMEDFLPEKGTPKELEQINVANFVTEAYPPTFLMTASGDFLKYQAPVMLEKLQEKNVPMIYRFYTASDALSSRKKGEKERELGHVFHLNMRVAEGSVCNDEECEFFRGFCK